MKQLDLFGATPPNTTDRPFSVVDLFCGGGGSSEGIRQALGCDPIVALNHNKHAIQTHKLNHPRTHHAEQDVFQMDPRATLIELGVMDLDLLWASPDCVHFSRARGSKPMEGGRRALAESLIPWARDVRPRFIMIENVAEFLTWGPLNKDGTPNKRRAGEFFEAWIAELESFGYSIEWRQLKASDYGEATSRVRLFIICARQGEEIRWPEITHGPTTSTPYRSAAECVNWSHKANSIFGRKKALAPKTLARVAKGIERYVLNCEAPYIVPSGEDSQAPFLAPRYGERPTQAPRTHSIQDPTPTIVPTGNSTRLASMVMKNYGGMVGNHPSKPFGAITARDSHGLATASLVAYYGTCKDGQGLRDPLRTITTKGRFGLVETILGTEATDIAREAGAFLAEHCGVTLDSEGLAHVTVEGTDYVVTDIGMRMMQPDELAAAMGFPETYQWPGSKTEQTARIGNAVPVRVAAALASANLRAVAAVRQAS